MRYFGFKRGLGRGRVFGFGASSIPVVANFVTGAYTKGGSASTFNDTFAFSRDSLAWLVSGATINEYAKNAPRITNAGLLIEKQSTNYARWSFLPQDAEFSRTSGTIYVNGFWQKAGSTGANLYASSFVDIVEQSVFSITAAPAAGTNRSNFSSLVANNGVRPTTKMTGVVKDVFYYIADSVSTSFSGIVWDAGETYSTSTLPLAFQIEKGSIPTSPIKTTTAPVTRLADVLSLKSNATSVTGDWDSTLSLSIVDGQLTHTGYGYIRSLMIT